MINYDLTIIDDVASCSAQPATLKGRCFQPVDLLHVSLGEGCSLIDIGVKHQRKLVRLCIHFYIHLVLKCPKQSFSDELKTFYLCI